MSFASAPSRPTRGVPVPGIDTRGPSENVQVSTPFGAWPLTPQSSEASRRPSLAYSSLSDTHSGPSSINGFSQPATPVSSMETSFDFTPQRSHRMDAKPSLPTGVLEHCAGHMRIPALASNSSQSLYTLHDAPGATLNSPVGHAFSSFETQYADTSPMKNGWAEHQHETDFHEALKPTIYHASPNSSHQAIPAYGHPNNPLEASAFQIYGVLSSDAPFGQHMQVVVPSQVGPREDFPMADCPKYEEHPVPDGFSHSFDSTATGYGGWESVHPPSPMEAYFGCADEEDFVSIKTEGPLTPTSSVCLDQTLQYGSASYASPHNQRRSSKRNRKHNVESKAWSEREVGNLVVRCEGTRFDVGLDEHQRLRIINTEGKTAKPHKCVAEVAPGKVCNARFERSEHLKRHMASHTKEKKYHCPLPGCGKRIARPDNAGDHFKTHLRKNAKGKRNTTHNWAELEPLLFEQYDEKVAQKMVTNLRKWLCTENVKADGGHEQLGFPLIQWHRLEAERRRIEVNGDKVKGQRRRMGGARQESW